jgi:DNA polymerase-3 subunit epsilon
MRQVVLDTETTGLEISQGNRIIEIGCVELVDRKLSGRHYHQYICPNREVEEGAFEVHGISNEFLADKPTFEQIVGDFMQFVDGAELVIHNAPFDIGFLNNELRLVGSAYPPMEQSCNIVDSLVLARHKHPGQKNNLDALCKRYGIDNTHRQLHGALLDAEILADVYLLMTGGQTALMLGQGNSDESSEVGEPGVVQPVRLNGAALSVIRASAAELEAHHAYLDMLEKKSSDGCVWLRGQQPDAG